MRFERGDDALKMLGARDAEFLYALLDVLAIDSCGKALFLKGFFYGVCVHGGEVACFDFRQGDEETGEFVDCEEGFREIALPRNAGVVTMAEDCLDKGFRIALFFEDLGSLGRVLFEIRMAFIIEVVEQTGNPVEVWVFVEVHCICFHGNRDCTAMSSETF